MPSIKYKKKTYAGGSMPVLEMTKAQYEALPAAKQNSSLIFQAYGQMSLAIVCVILLLHLSIF